MSNKAVKQVTEVTVNIDQGLFVIPTGYGGYSCLGFEVCQRKITAIKAELLSKFNVGNDQEFGIETIENYNLYSELCDLASSFSDQNNYRFQCELSPQLMGLEGRRVEVITIHGEKRRFKVGKSTGWMPCHLELANTRSHGGMPADIAYQSVTIIR